MDERQALSVFAALSQETRLRILRMLVIAGRGGLAAGAIAERAEVSPSNVSFHLKELEQAGLVRSRRESRSVIYSAEYDTLSGLIRFLMEDCCAASPAVCAPLADVVTQAACCVPEANDAALSAQPVES
ncbi:Transcriptional regulator, ArsR family [Rubellimicrobium mesophilum DSM 19309]|uniref:Transcriptional regulator, ArsR family n=1 Tax=Rubellimicrobium mesophilum DSM 19309 TaxID=442562 RepID=A0A017HI47_9RHOB|nr:metalloregulator ArsR/SmtB family transcription factor [Rubellimicrobium mesophilum]EYD73838.1 Transcriptional regulator, ArsR family [Rubellimicrobium mesophilum DSM 19309]